MFDGRHCVTGKQLEKVGMRCNKCQTVTCHKYYDDVHERNKYDIVRVSDVSKSNGYAIIVETGDT